MRKFPHPTSSSSTLNSLSKVTNGNSYNYFVDQAISQKTKNRRKMCDEKTERKLENKSYAKCGNEEKFVHPVENLLTLK
jgi:hypothetical protein